MKPKELKRFKESNQARIRVWAESWINHVRSERDRKRLIPNKVLELARDWEIKVHTLWKNMQLARALFVSDELDIMAVSDEGILAQELTDNANKVLKYDTMQDDFREVKDIIVCDNSLFGISATVIENFDDEDVKSIIDTIDPLSIIPDPKNCRGSKMRFIGLEKQVTVEYIKNNPTFDKTERESVTQWLSEEWKKTEQARNFANRTLDVPDDEITNLVLFFSAWEGNKYMSVWANNYEYCLKVVELEALTKSEKLNPNKIKYPVQLHRKKPMPNSFFGASDADELLPLQKVQSELANYQVIGARKDELGDDYILDSRLWLNASLLADLESGGNFITADFTQLQGSNPFIQVPKWTSWGNRAQNMMQFLDQLWQETSGNSDIAFGQSPNWQQTKAEIQTMQQNANNILNWVGWNLMDSMKELVTDMYRAYALYMPNKRKKVISWYDRGQQFALSLSKKEFVADWGIQITLVSKAQQAIQDEKDYQKIIASINIILPNLQSNYHVNKLLRLSLKKSWINGIDPRAYIPESVEEITATANLELLNNNYDVSEPYPTEDLWTYRDIYSQALPTPAKRKILDRIDQLIIDTKSMQWEQGWVSNAQTWAMAMSQIASQQSNQPISTSNVSL